MISLSEFYFGLRRPILLVQTKELISMSCGSRKGSSKPWRFDLKFTLRDIHINSSLNSLTKLTSNSRSTKLKDPSLTEHLPNYHEDRPNQYENWDNHVIKISQWRESHYITNTITRKKKKGAGLWESELMIRVGKLTIWVRSFEIIAEFSSLSVPPEEV